MHISLSWQLAAFMRVGDHHICNFDMGYTKGTPNLFIWHKIMLVMTTWSIEWGCKCFRVT